MKVVLVLAALAAVAVARPQAAAPSAAIPILDYQLTRDSFGQFASSYISGDGTKVSEQGALVPNEKNDGHVLIKKGSYSYTSPDGTPIQLDWSADTEGFHAQGEHLPTTPAAPVAPSA